MIQPLERLDALLKEILEMYEALLEMGKKKREALAGVRVEEIETITRQEEAIIFQIGKLEAVRMRLAADIANAQGLLPQDLTLAKIKEIAGADDARRLAETEAGLSKVLSELKPLNKLNTELIHQSLSFINYNLNLMAQTQVGPTYAPQGHAQQNQVSKALVDRKV